MRKSTTPSKQEQIDEIMDYFNFARVQKAMEATGWSWVKVDFPVSEADLRKEARRILLQVEEGMVIETGGFLARNCEGFLELRFCISEWKIDPEDYQ